jgi:hypothetical protein
MNDETGGIWTEIVVLRYNVGISYDEPRKSIKTLTQILGLDLNQADHLPMRNGRSSFTSTDSGDDDDK